jgi:hypothetical protein
MKLSASTSFQMGKSTIEGALKAQAAIILFNYVATYLSLVLQKPKFERLRPYPTDAAFDRAKVKAQVVASMHTPEEKEDKESERATSSVSPPHQVGFRPPPRF